MSKTSIYFLLVLTCLASFLLAAGMGSVSISFREILSGLSTPGLPHTLVYELRLPRAMAAFVCGGMLALAGLLMQVLLRNPLADPYILGVSGGAATGALLAILFGLGSLMTQTAAFAGALLSIVLVFVLAHGQTSWTSNRLLLTGVILAAGWNAFISFILTISPDQQIHGMLFWLMGDLSNTRVTAWHGFLLLAITIGGFFSARQLNILARGELQASALGVNTRQLRILLFFSASLLTAIAISLAGSIGFIGLMVPHMLRLMMGADHRALVPASVLLGGSLLVLADTFSRSVLAPIQIPVGILTAALGVPTFLYLLYRNRT
ncbi:MAG TPA: iron ABC transporter permease [Gammaproteobacteria bacterium]|nr:iron ABC transporter permease [Gammaproteobacteria bacterium]